MTPKTAEKVDGKYVTDQCHMAPILLTLTIQVDSPTPTCT